MTTRKRRAPNPSIHSFADSFMIFFKIMMFSLMIRPAAVLQQSRAHEGQRLTRCDFCQAAGAKIYSTKYAFPVPPKSGAHLNERRRGLVFWSACLRWLASRLELSGGEILF